MQNHMKLNKISMIFILFSTIFLLIPTKSNSEETGFKSTQYIHQPKFYYAKVSWYKHGKKTANGEKFNPNNITVAHKKLPFGTLVKFTNTETNTSIIARVNDRGPYFKGREFDLTLKGAKLLKFKKQGIAILKIEILG